MRLDQLPAAAFRAVIGCALITLGLTLPAGARANAPIYQFSQTTTTTQAGGHPDIRTRIWMGNRATQNIPAPSCNCQDPKEVYVEAPSGVIGVPRALPQCNAADFGETLCPIDTQIGIAYIDILGKPLRPNEPHVGANGKIDTNEIDGLNGFPIPVFNLIPRPGQAGLIGFYAPYINSPVYLVASARTESDYGLNLETAAITHVVPVSVVDLTLWGVPADPSHDPLRLGPPGCNSQAENLAEGCVGANASNSPLTPFIDNPTTCGLPLSTSLEVTSYDNGTASASAPYPATTGCDQLDFNPSLFGQPTTTATDTPSGLEIDLEVPQDASPSVPSPSEIRATTVTLPEGFSINSSAADGKSACSDVEARIGVRDEAQCPEFAKVGTLSVSSSSLPGPLPGYVYLGEPRPGDRYRLLLVADGFGIHVKLPGSVHADPRSGQLTASFENLPQFPFSDFNMHFFGSERGLLVTPTRCGLYSVDSTFTPWDSVLPDQSSKQFFTLDSGPDGMPCPGTARSFDPGFEAGVSDKTAGAHAPFALQLTRDDGDQNLTRLNVSTPPGLSATLRGVPYCPEAAIDKLSSVGYSGSAESASSTCPEASLIGTATGGVGAGSHPVYVTGKVYLAGPYKGAPLSLEVVFPAVSGPYDLGVIAVRAAINVDPVTAQVSAVSDVFPQILEGVPLRARFIRISLDRPNFMLNPTNCDPFAVAALIAGDEGGSAVRSRHFQAANCTDLTYEPRLSLKLSGGVKRRGHPAIRALFTARPGESNTRKVSVALPRGELLDNAHIRAICTRVQFATESCPAGSLIGTAEASTPLLDQPLKGNVYLRSSSHELPDLVMDLNGQIHIELVGRIDSAKGGGMRTTFEGVPDTPVSAFVLNLTGGAKGLLQNSESLCGKAKKAITKMIGQNGAVVKTKTTLQTPCGPKATQHKRYLRRVRVVH